MGEPLSSAGFAIARLTRSRGTAAGFSTNRFDRKLESGGVAGSDGGAALCSLFEGAISSAYGTRHFDFFEASRPRPKRSGKLVDSLGIRDMASESGNHV